MNFSIYFYLSRLAYWLFFNQLIIILIIFLVSYFLLIYDYKKLSRILTKFSIIYLIFMALLPTGYSVLYMLERESYSIKDLPSDLDGVLVLSGSENINKTIDYDHIYSLGSTNRIIESLRLQNHIPKIKIIFSGGTIKSSKEPPSTFVAEKFYSELSNNFDKIIFESDSTNTYENITNSYKIVKPKEDDKWVLLTSAFHMKRAKETASTLGWEMIAYPVDFKTHESIFDYMLNFNIIKNIELFQIASHEIVGILIYKLLDKA
tara:strand:- start:1083 stop:1868 length:786 start_codon:yes stop_codon:yes gene_type:complete